MVAQPRRIRMHSALLLLRHKTALVQSGASRRMNISTHDASTDKYGHVLVGSSLRIFPSIAHISSLTRHYESALARSQCAVPPNQ